MAMTMASRGRSTKIADALQALDDDQLAARKPFLDDYAGAALASGLDALDRSLAVLDHEHIDALLIGDQRRLRYDDLFHGRAAFEADAHQLTVD
jgi:hypothetical protein